MSVFSRSRMAKMSRSFMRRLPSRRGRCRLYLLLSPEVKKGTKKETGKRSRVECNKRTVENRGLKIKKWLPLSGAKPKIAYSLGEPLRTCLERCRCSAGKRGYVEEPRGSRVSIVCP